MILHQDCTSGIFSSFTFEPFFCTGTCYISCRSGEEWICSPQTVSLEELYVHRCAHLLTLKLPNCEGKTGSVFLLPLFHLLRSIWWFLEIFFRLQKHCWGEKLPPPSVFLSAAWDFASYCKLQEMRQMRKFLLWESILCTWLLQLDPCGLFITSHTYVQGTSTYFIAFPFHHMRTHFLPFYSPVHTLAFYYSSSDCVGRIH